MKCELCNKAIAELFLNKIKGTYVQDTKGKLHTLCFECQKHFRTKQEILKKLPL